MDSQNLTRLAIRAAGGRKAVSEAIGISAVMIRRWESEAIGLPRTEWTGETNYAERLAELARVAGEKVTATAILKQQRVWKLARTVDRRAIGVQAASKLNAKRKRLALKKGARAAAL